MAVVRWGVSAEPALYAAQPASSLAPNSTCTSIVMRLHLPSIHLGNGDENSNEQGRQQYYQYPGGQHEGYQPVYMAPPPPAPPANFPIPKLRLEAKDLGRTGTALFLKHINASEVLHDAVISVLTTLYTLETCPRQYVSFPASVLTWLTCF